MRQGKIIGITILIAVIQSIVGAQTVSIQSWSVSATAPGVNNSQNGNILTSASVSAPWLDTQDYPPPGVLVTATASAQWSDPYFQMMTDLGYPITAQMLRVQASSDANQGTRIEGTTNVTFNVPQPVLGLIYPVQDTGSINLPTLTGPGGSDWFQYSGGSIDRFGNYKTFAPGTYTFTLDAGNLFQGHAWGGYFDFQFVFLVPEPAGATILLACATILAGRRRSC